MLHKSFELLETKAEGDSGEFTAIVSTFGNVDKVGDRIINGAYTKTLAKWAKSGDPIPIILAHQWDDVMAHVGYATADNVKQVAQGLEVKGKLDVEDNPVARQVHKLMKRRTLKEFSIGYSVPAGGEHRAKDGANEITEIDLAECGPCLKGIDPKTELREVKSALGVAELPDAAAQRKAANDAAREVEGTRVPDVPPAPVMPPVDHAAALAEVKAELAETQRLLEEATKAPPKDAKALRDEATKAARELEEQQLPNVPPAPVVEQEDVVAKELQEVKAQIAAMAKGLEDLAKKAEVTDPRSVDPLRKQADDMALEIARGDLPTPTKTVAVKRPEPALTLAELRKQTRTEMLSVLSGGPIE